MTKPQHSPLPWKVRENGTYIRSAKTHELLAKVNILKADADFIVQSVNRAPLFEEMVKLLKTAYCIVAEAMPEQAPDAVAFVSVQKGWLKQAEQAIARAEAEK